MLGSVQQGGDALVRLNDAFAPDPVFVDVPAACRSSAPVLVVHWCDGGVRPFPRTCVRAARVDASRSVEVFAGAEGADRTLVVPVTELAAGDGGRRWPTSPCRCWRPPPGRSPAWPGRGTADSYAAHVHRRARRRPTTGSAPTSRSRAGTPAARSSRPISATATQVHDIRTLQDHVAPRTTSELLCQGAVAGHVALGLQRAHPGAPGGRAQRRPPDQPQPRPRRGGPRRLGAQPRHPRERRDVLARLDGGPGRRGPALLHRVARRGARSGRGADRARASSTPSSTGRPFPRPVPLLQREVHERLDVALGGRALPAGV